MDAKPSRRMAPAREPPAAASSSALPERPRSLWLRVLLVRSARTDASNASLSLPAGDTSIPPEMLG